MALIIVVRHRVGFILRLLIIQQLRSASFAELLRKLRISSWPLTVPVRVTVRLLSSARLVFAGAVTILTLRVLRNGEIPPETVLETIWESPNILTR